MAFKKTGKTITIGVVNPKPPEQPIKTDNKNSNIVKPEDKKNE